MSAQRTVTVTLAAALAVTLAACSTSGSPVTPGTPKASVPTPITTSAASSGCGTKAVAAARAALTAHPEVSRIEVDGGCHQLSIDTTMASADQLSPSSTKAVAICDAAAKVGYVDGVSSVTVSWTDGHEAAAGLQGHDCIPG